MQRRIPKIEVSVVFTIGFFVFIVHLTRTVSFASVIGDLVLSPLLTIGSFGF